MYRKSVKDNSKFLIPFIEGIKYYGSNEIENVLGTMIVLNENNDVLTCKHIAQEFINNDERAIKYNLIMEELKDSKNEVTKKEIEKKYNLKNDSIVLSNIHFPFEVGDNFTVNIIFHKYLDLAIIKFNGAKINVSSYPRFSKTYPMQGQSVCKLGFAFSEYDLFEYSNFYKSIVLKDKIINSFPLFPLDGIVTRLIMDDKGKTSMYETSSMGIRGQSGGPVFDKNGIVYGIQSMTKHMDLNFDIDMNVKRGIKNKSIYLSQILNLGICISSVDILDFLKENNIKYY